MRTLLCISYISPKVYVCMCVRKRKDERNTPFASHIFKAFFFLHLYLSMAFMLFINDRNNGPCKNYGDSGNISAGFIDRSFLCCQRKRTAPRRWHLANKALKVSNGRAKPSDLHPTEKKNT